MTQVETHLTEDERQAFADDTLSVEQRASAEAHLAACPSCADDVARLTTLMKRIHETPAPQSTAPLDELWPSIRARIEQGKLVSLPADAPAVRGSSRRMWWFSSIGGVAAAVLIGMAVMRGRPTDADDSVGPGATAITGEPSLVAVVDSAHAYEQEARILLDKLELRRAMLRPETAEALARDLHVVDVAIAELKEAVARDPNNPALRRLLATSYRQKVDLLKRVSNAS
jgi:hypothetical protein